MRNQASPEDAPERMLQFQAILLHHESDALTSLSETHGKSPKAVLSEHVVQICAERIAKVVVQNTLAEDETPFATHTKQSRPTFDASAEMFGEEPDCRSGKTGPAAEGGSRTPLAKKPN